MRGAILVTLSSNPPDDRRSSILMKDVFNLERLNHIGVKVGDKTLVREGDLPMSRIALTAFRGVSAPPGDWTKGTSKFRKII